MSRASINLGSVKITGTVPNSDFGDYFVKLRAYDDFGKETIYTVNVEIIENLTPTTVIILSLTY